MRAVATLLSSLALLACTLSAFGATPQFVAVRISEPIAMTGKLDDPRWQLAKPATEAFQAYPHAMAPSPYPMQVRMLYDDEYLYVGIEAGDPEPDLIREHFVRRDRLFSPNSDDVLLLYLDALNTGRSAQMFAVNPRDNQLDGYWIEATQAEDFTSDFNWSALSARTDTGWSTVMRIPFTSLQHRPGKEQVWKLVVWQNVIRENFYQIASTKIPGTSNCLLCYAGDVVLSDFPEGATGDPLSITPEVTVTHEGSDGDGADAGDGSGNDANIGGYLRWRPRHGTVVDGMWNPDFSQLESDKFQPTANNQFALLFPEKRPFFLESSNLFNSPVQAIYTRSITRPRWGLRLTEQMAGGSQFTLLASEDRGGGSVIEPGTLTSALVPQPESSIATAGRMQHFASGWRSGGLFSYRRYGDGSYNFVAGPDLMWTPTPGDRVRAQYLFSKTENPERPDLYAGWLGQSMTDSAVFLDWSHATGSWTWKTEYQHLGDGFRVWEGFVPQAGIDQVDASLGYNFFPEAGGWLNILTPQVLYTRAESSDGDLVLGSVAPSLVINGAMSLYAVLS